MKDSMIMGINEFARVTGVPSHTLRRLHLSGKFIPCVVTEGGHRRYEESQVESAKEYVRKMKLLLGGKNVLDENEKLDDFFSYILGLIMADGTVSAKGQVQLEMKDKQIMDDVAGIVGAEVHPRLDRNMFRITVPRPIACRLVEYGVCRRKSKGFDVPSMSEKSFGCFLRGLFDGDGSASIRKGRRILRFAGHPRAMAYIQRTLLEGFGLYLPWVDDNRLESGMLETGRSAVVDAVCGIMYATEGPCLWRKRQLLKGGYENGNGLILAHVKSSLIDSESQRAG